VKRFKKEQYEERKRESKEHNVGKKNSWNRDEPEKGGFALLTNNALDCGERKGK